MKRVPDGAGVYPPVLTLDAPQVEEIARVIWRRQRDALSAEAFAHSIMWRDKSIPMRFWDEFENDARAVLQLLYDKHVQRQNACARLPRLRGTHIVPQHLHVDDES